MWLVRPSIMPARRNAKGRQKWCEEFVGSHALSTRRLSTMLVAAGGVDMMGERERGGLLPGQCMYASHVRCSSSVQIRPMHLLLRSLVFPTPPTHHTPAKSPHFLARSNQRKLFQAVQCSNNYTISENGRSLRLRVRQAHCLGFELC
jgi:hypothetical protein